MKISILPNFCTRHRVIYFLKCLEQTVYPMMAEGNSSSQNLEIDIPNLSPSFVMTSSIKKFIFKSKSKREELVSESETLVVIIPERMEASYGLYVWPSAQILAWYLYEHRQFLPGKKILELGAGTALPGIVSALCGARVTLSDSAKLPHCLDQCRKSVEANNLGGRVKIIGLTWGLFLSDVFKFRGQLDIILGSDCFYDPVVFDDLLATIAYLLESNPGAKFLSTYQERSADWSIEPLLTKWGLKCKHIPLNELADSCEIDLLQLTQDHTIHLLEITSN